MRVTYVLREKWQSSLACFFLTLSPLTIFFKYYNNTRMNSYSKSPYTHFQNDVLKYFQIIAVDIVLDNL